MKLCCFKALVLYVKWYSINSKQTAVNQRCILRSLEESPEKILQRDIAKMSIEEIERTTKRYLIKPKKTGKKGEKAIKKRRA